VKMGDVTTANRLRAVRRHSLVVLAAVASTACLLTGCGASASSKAPPAPGSDVGTRVNFAVKRDITKIPMVNYRGKTVSLSSFTGKVLVISDSMTLCQEDCPLDTTNIVAAARELDKTGQGRHVEFLTITVDPGRDTPRRLTKYRQFYARASTLPNWDLLTGTKRNLSLLWKYFGVYWKQVPEDSPPDKDWLTGKPLMYDIEHADDVIFLDASQHERFIIDGHARVPSAHLVPSEMRHFLSAQGRANMNRPGTDAWTSAQVAHTVDWLEGGT
jgi:protein SCO1